MKKSKFPEDPIAFALKQAELGTSVEVGGWPTGSCINTSLVLDALLMALWRRRPKAAVTVHSDQGCQFTGHEWQTFCSSTTWSAA